VAGVFATNAGPQRELEQVWFQWKILLFGPLV